jgi:MoaA/NifB/PqqE/SkfB family radical SAM enzyme
MLSRPQALLPFDRLGAEALEWDGASGEITYATPVRQVFRCAHDALHRIEIFIEPTFHFKRSHLWLRVYEGDVTRHAAAGARPVRLAGPLPAAALTAHGWLSFEFEPLARSGGQCFTFELHAPDATPGNALAVRLATRPTRGGDGWCAGGRRLLGVVTFRAICLQAPALFENFRRYRARATQRTPTLDYHPLMVRLEISKPCNLHCIMCQRGLHPFDASGGAVGFLSLERFRLIEPILPTLLRVIALGLGEPFLNPQLLDILRHARALNPFAHLFTSTNGTRLSDDAIAAILDENLLSELQISLDGAERDTFERIRQKASFDTVIGSFERVAAARARRGTKSFSVAAAMLVMKPNQTQVLAFVRRMLALGVDRISLDSPKDAEFKPLRVDSDDGMKRVFEQVALADELLAGTPVQLGGPLLSELMTWHRESGQTWTPPRWGVDECAQLAQPATAPVPACAVPWESFTLAANGEVTVCCNSIRPMGDLRRETMGEVWERGPRYAAIRDELLTRRLHSDCRTCIGENFVRVDEATPPIYLAGSLPATERSALLARQLGRPAAEFPRAEPSLCRIGIDWTDESLSGESAYFRRHLSGWLEIPDRNDPVVSSRDPVILALAVHGVIRAHTNVAPTSHGTLPWRLMLELDECLASPDEIEWFMVGGAALRAVQTTPSIKPSLQLSATGQLHGYIDEVSAIDGTLHFRGWARDRISGDPAHVIVATVDGRPMCTARPWLPRPDVSRAFSGPGTHFGFSLGLPARFASSATAGRLALLAVDAQGAASPLEWGHEAKRTLDNIEPPHDAIRTMTQTPALAST